MAEIVLVGRRAQSGRIKEVISLYATLWMRLKKISPRSIMLFFGFLLTFFLLTVDQSHLKSIDSVRSRLSDTLHFFSFPFVYTAKKLQQGLTTVEFLTRDANAYQKLKTTEKELYSLKHRMAAIEAENKILRRHLHLFSPTLSPRQAARVIGHSKNPYHTLFINAGTVENVYKGQVVVIPEGLVGRVIRVAKHTAEVLLITNPQLRLPVRFMKSRTQAIIKGDNQPHLAILYSQNSDPHREDDLITSGVGGIFPAGLKVGQFSRKNGVQSLFIPQQLEYVYLLPPPEPASRVF